MGSAFQLSPNSSLVLRAKGDLLIGVRRRKLKDLESKGEIVKSAFACDRQAISF